MTRGQPVRLDVGAMLLAKADKFEEVAERFRRAAHVEGHERAVLLDEASALIGDVQGISLAVAIESVRVAEPGAVRAAAVDVLLQLRGRLTQAGAVLALHETRAGLQVLDAMDLDPLAGAIHSLVNQAVQLVDRELTARGVEMGRPR